jgi:hypothetical protein
MIITKNLDHWIRILKQKLTCMVQMKKKDQTKKEDQYLKEGAMVLVIMSQNWILDMNQ